jgi:hypothetical protein
MAFFYVQHIFSYTEKKGRTLPSRPFALLSVG